MIQVIQFILALTILVFLHEGGHFTFAKMFKTRVSRFYIFANWKFHLFSTYDNWWRKLWRKPLITERENGSKKYNDEAGTEYGIGWLPIGGYCQIDGMVDETQSAEELAKKPVQPWEFRSKKPWQKLLIMAGGVMVNFILAFVIYSGCLYYWGEDYIATKDMTMGMKFNDDAKKLGFKDHDIMLGTEKGEFREWGADLYRDLTSAHECYVIRDGKKMTIKLPGKLNLLDMMKKTPKFVEVFQPLDIDSLLPEGPLAKAGVKPGDKLLSFNGKQMDSYNTLSAELKALNEPLRKANTKEDSLKVRTATLVVRHSATGVTDTLSVVLAPGPKNLLCGFSTYKKTSQYKVTHVSYSILESIPAGIDYGCNILGGYVGDMKYLFSADGAKSLGGFGTIGSLFPDTWNWHIFWMMTAFLSIILAFMNILPIPGLDGGHIMFLFYQIIVGKEPSPKFQQMAQNIGFGLLLVLMVVANLNDVLRWLHLM